MLSLVFFCAKKKKKIVREAAQLHLFNHNVSFHKIQARRCGDNTENICVLLCSL